MSAELAALREGSACALPGEVRRRLPQPLGDEPFELLRVGIYDDPGVRVWRNQAGDFAFLDPLPSVDYGRYRSRVLELQLGDYYRDTCAEQRRLEKLAPYFAGIGAYLDVGCGDAAFLALVRRAHRDLELAGAESDAVTRPLRDRVEGLQQLADVASAPAASFDVVSLFHVLEHIADPVPFLRACLRPLRPGGRLLIEVPSGDDPLLGLYAVPAYADFFYQRQHPYTYSAASLRRLLEHHGFEVERVLAHQRYGLENHLHWLRAGKPGGDAQLRAITAEADAAYRRGLEASGHCDAAIAVVVQRG